MKEPDIRIRAVKCCCMFLLVVLLSGGSQAATPVRWEDLRDPAVSGFDDPFATLGMRELRSLASVLRLRTRLDQAGVPSEERLRMQDLLNDEEARLAVAGVRTDWLLSRRKEIAGKRAAAALAGNPELSGRLVTIAGYVIPVLSPETGSVEGGYLVPESGMCSHMPAPDPNQMIRYSLKTDWNADQIYQRVLFTGHLTLNTTRQEINLLDGQIEMLSAFDLDVTDVTDVGKSTDASLHRLPLFFHQSR